jgi:hypothetical protein
MYIPKNIYDLLEKYKVNDYILIFDNDSVKKYEERLKLLYNEVIKYLDNLNINDFVEEVNNFLKYILINEILDINLFYYENILFYYHSKGFLTFREKIKIDKKQKVDRYLLIIEFSNGECITKTFSSIREISDTIGMKPHLVKSFKKLRLKGNNKDTDNLSALY